MSGTFIDEDIEAAVARATEAAVGKTSASSVPTSPSSASSVDCSTRSSSTSLASSSATACGSSPLPAVSALEGVQEESWRRQRAIAYPLLRLGVDETDSGRVVNTSAKRLVGFSEDEIAALAAAARQTIDDPSVI